MKEYWYQVSYVFSGSDKEEHANVKAYDPLQAARYVVRMYNEVPIIFNVKRLALVTPVQE